MGAHAASLVCDARPVASLRSLFVRLTRRRRQHLDPGPLGFEFVVLDDEAPDRPTPVWRQPRRPHRGWTGRS